MTGEKRIPTWRRLRVLRVRTLGLFCVYAVAALLLCMALMQLQTSVECSERLKQFFNKVKRKVIGKAKATLPGLSFLPDVMNEGAEKVKSITESDKKLHVVGEMAKNAGKGAAYVFDWGKPSADELPVLQVLKGGFSQQFQQEVGKPVPASEISSDKDWMLGKTVTPLDGDDTQKFVVIGHNEDGLFVKDPVTGKVMQHEDSELDQVSVPSIQPDSPESVDKSNLFKPVNGLLLNRFDVSKPKHLLDGLKKVAHNTLAMVQGAFQLVNIVSLTNKLYRDAEQSNSEDDAVDELIDVRLLSDDDQASWKKKMEEKETERIEKKAEAYKKSKLYMLETTREFFANIFIGAFVNLVMITASLLQNISFIRALVKGAYWDSSTQSWLSHNLKYEAAANSVNLDRVVEYDRQKLIETAQQQSDEPDELFTTLGVSRDSTVAEIKLAAEEKKSENDKSGGSEDTEMAITEAASILEDPERRLALLILGKDATTYTDSHFQTDHAFLSMLDKIEANTYIGSRGLNSYNRITYRDINDFNEKIQKYRRSELALSYSKLLNEYVEARKDGKLKEWLQNQKQNLAAISLPKLGDLCLEGLANGLENAAVAAEGGNNNVGALAGRTRKAVKGIWRDTQDALSLHDYKLKRYDVDGRITDKQSLRNVENTDSNNKFARKRYFAALPENWTSNARAIQRDIEEDVDEALQMVVKNDDRIKDNTIARKDAVDFIKDMRNVAEEALNEYHQSEGYKKSQRITDLTRLKIPVGHRQ